MNPFDGPPSTPAVSYDPPQGPPRRRGRLFGAALIGAGLVGAGAIGVSALASADDPDLATTTVETIEPTETEPTSTEPTSTEPTDTDVRDVDGTMLSLDDDLRRLSECVGVSDIWRDAPSGSELPQLDEMFDQMFDEDTNPDELFRQLFGEDANLDELIGELFGEDANLDELFGDLEREWDVGGDIAGDAAVPQLDELPLIGDGLVMVLGPDGPTLVDLGDGDASVTIERDGDNGDVTITTDGSATEFSGDRLIDEFITPVLPDELRSCLEEADASDR